ncbi:hypothetical protein HYFRA_00000344 [Hymenoscyphus fraxineus]|uniref:Heterokaryon incompatibility domain-containing protein n=1 Tax=Hymenoscyphus fraxineus TaxID=746836 RepID=A0A9N9L1C8_9HELO|nr:hypothetical protein HYFRA_00000344 [Hymenoscyphus fraxineus]
MSDPISSTPALYRPLKAANDTDGEFRLLTLLPGRQESPICCNLAVAPLHSPPHYEALSYTWGNPFSSISETQVSATSTFTILLNGNRFPIGFNLEGALRFLRYEERERILWIDALCIDQGNDEEKSCQVRAMSRIYRNAGCVLAWLGSGDRHAELAFETLDVLYWVAGRRFVEFCSASYGVAFGGISEQQIARLLMDSLGFPEDVAGCLDGFTSIRLERGELEMPIEGFIQSTWPSSDTTRFVNDILFHHEILAESSELQSRINSIREVFSFRSYWDRLWVLQEQLMAKNLLILCGHHQLQIHKMSLIRWFLDVESPSGFLTPRELGGCLINLVDTHGFVLRRKEDKMSLAKLVQTYGHRTCLDPRDVIFSLLGVAAPIDVEIDYSRSVQDVFRRATRKMIEQEGNLDILCNDPKLSTALQDRLGDQKAHGYIPSWVPNFGVSFSTNYFIAEGATYDAQYYKAGGSKVTRKVSSVSHTDENILILRGFTFDQIKTTHPRQYVGNAERSPYWSASNTWEPNVLDALRKYWDTARSWWLSTSTHQIPEEKFWKTLLLDRYRDHSNYTPRISHTTSSRLNFENDIKQAIDTSSPPPRLLDCLAEMSEGKSCCITRNGGMAMVVGDVEVGDVVFVPRNCSCCLVLRPLVGGMFEGKRFRLVGPAYVHGIMDGEVVEMMERMGVDEEVVFLV